LIRPNNFSGLQKKVGKKDVLGRNRVVRKQGVKGQKRSLTCR